MLNSKKIVNLGFGTFLAMDKRGQKGTRKMIDRILAAIDPSRESARALRLAIELAREIGAELKVIIVLKPLPACFSFAVSAVFAQMWKRANSQKSSTLHSHAKQQMAKAGIFPDAELVAGSEVHTILRCAKQYRADLIVMGLRNRTIVMDRTAQDVADRSSCAVLGVP